MYRITRCKRQIPQSNGFNSNYALKNKENLMGLISII